MHKIVSAISRLSVSGNPARIKGSGRLTTAAFVQHSLAQLSGGRQVEPNPEKRDTPRFEHEATIMVENYPTGQYHEGRMYNYSRNGMYFESDFAPAVGADIFVGIENSPYSSGHDVYRAKVVWCKELPEGASYYYYGVGLNYY